METMASQSATTFAMSPGSEKTRSSSGMVSSMSANTRSKLTGARIVTFASAELGLSAVAKIVNKTKVQHE